MRIENWLHFHALSLPATSQGCFQDMDCLRVDKEMHLGHRGDKTVAVQGIRIRPDSVYPENGS